MRTPDDTGLTGAQQTAQPRDRRRFLTGVVTGSFLGSLLAGGVNLYAHMQPGLGWWFRAGHGPGGSWRQGAYDPGMVRVRIECATDWILSRGARGFTVTARATASDGLKLLRQGGCAALALDIMLPDLDSFEVCRRSHAESDIPILMLTARGDEMTVS